MKKYDPTKNYKINWPVVIAGLILIFISVIGIMFGR